MTLPLPTIFISHGAPSFALEPGIAGARLADLGKTLPRPQAVVVISPHWQTPGIAVTAAAAPATLHDFAGFGAALEQLRYTAPGNPELAAEVATLLGAAGWPARLDPQRGRDHGVWVPLLHLYPAADLPVIQVSMPLRLDAKGAWALGTALSPLARRGVLLIGSGSLTHNLYELQPDHLEPQAYVAEFAAWVRDALRHADRERLLDTLRLAPHATRAHPTPEHFLPLILAAGAARLGEAGGAASVQVLPGEVTHGVLAMEGYLFANSSVT